MGQRILFTIGHSNRTWAEFVDLLREWGIEQLVDVRTVPRSRAVPWFWDKRMALALPKAGIAYVHMPALGGLRRAKKDSANTGWRNASFRGYADYMQMAEFKAEIDWLMEQVARRSVVAMCAEAVPWRCHRSLIADAVLARGAAVDDIFVTPEGSSTRKPHALTSFAQTEGGRVWYPAGSGDLFG